jgi:hypothetical protein
MRVTSVLRSCAVLASLKTRSLLRFNHHQESSLITRAPCRTGCACRCIRCRSRREATTYQCR